MQQFEGNFQFDSNGALVGGTFTDISEFFSDGSLWWSINDFSISYATVESLIFNNVDVLGFQDIILAGADEADTIFTGGGDGDDILQSGQGNDLMRGEAGTDTFVYTSAADAGLIANAEHDVIQFFSRADGDQLDFSGMAEGTFSFLSGGTGVNDFTGAGNEIAFKAYANNSIVYVDVNGDSAVDMEINFVNAGGITLTSSDFIL